MNWTGIVHRRFGLETQSFDQSFHNGRFVRKAVTTFSGHEARSMHRTLSCSNKEAQLNRNRNPLERDNFNSPGRSGTEMPNAYNDGLRAGAVRIASQLAIQSSLAVSVVSIPLLAVVFVAAVVSNPSTAHARLQEEATNQEATPQVPDAALAVGEKAATAQNAGEFPFAATQWDALVDSWPECSLAPTAFYNAGVCYFQQNDYPTAIERLKSAIANLPPAETEKITLAHLYLGFSQARLGKQIQLDNAEDKDPQLAEQSNILLTTATNTFDRLLKNYPEFADADQACFFQGEAYELLGRLDKAAESYAKMPACPSNHAFKFDGLFALGNVYEQQLGFDRALATYNDFVAEAEKNGGHGLLNEVNFRTGVTHLQLATAAEKTGDNETATGHFQSASGLFQSAADSGFSLADRARYQQAFCQSRLGNHADAAALYEQVSKIESSSVAELAAVQAGREYFNAGSGENAERLLVTTANADNPTPAGINAAHQLARIYTDRAEHQKAYDTATLWIPLAADNPLQVDLMMDQADAAYQIADKKAESAELYLKIADGFDDHKLAPTALYNAAFSRLESKEHASAIELAGRFKKTYAEHPFFPDAIEIEAEAKLASGDAKTAATAFRGLVAAHTENPKSNAWALRVGLCEYINGQYEPTINWLEPAVLKMTDPAQVAEAMHWIGSSQFNLKHNKPAIEALQKSVEASDNWSRADETLLTLSRALVADGRADEAEKIKQTLLTKFPQSTNIAEAVYRAGERAYSANDFAVALGDFQTVIDNHRGSKFVPLAMYDSAWSNLKLKNHDDATRMFGQLIEQFPKHKLASRAKIGRGAALRATGDAEGAIKDFDAFLSGEVTDQDRQEAMYEKGLAQVDLKQWAEAKATFEQLLEQNENSPLADHYHYEIAWAARSLEDEPAAIAHFNSIADKYAESPHAAEANFHKGNALYEAGKFDDAAAAYTLCVNSNAGNSLREKSAYKLGWCHYKKSDYETAKKHFTDQTTAFPEGELLADAKVMVAESLYQLDDFEGAFEAYNNARPAVEASQTVDAGVRWQTLLHGSQSANKAKHYTEAVEFAQPIVDSTATSAELKQQAWLEIGHANNGLVKTGAADIDAAFHAWGQAGENRGETGAEAHCMIGEALFAEKRYDEAVTAYKNVFYGYGGLQSSAEVKKWQAFAVFEAGQCTFVQIEKADPNAKPGLVDESLRLFNYLLDNYADQDARLIEQAQNQVERLTALKSGS